MVHGERQPADAQCFWTNFGCVPHRYLYESHGIRRGNVDAHLVHGPARAGVCCSGSGARVTREHVLGTGSAARPGRLRRSHERARLARADRQAVSQGIMLGFDARHTRAHGYRSILEAIALNDEDNVDAMTDELGNPAARSRDSGGGSSSPLFMQIFADVFGIPASTRQRPGRRQPSARRSVGAVATGVYPDFATAVARMEKPREAFAPDPGNTTCIAA